MKKPRTTFDPKTSQYCCPIILHTEEPADAPWHVAYVDADEDSVVVTEIVAPDGSEVSLDGLDIEWIEDQCRDELSAVWRDDMLLYKVRATA